MGWRRSLQTDVSSCFEKKVIVLRLLSAAFRNHMHWSELIGGDVVISPPYSWQLRFNASDIEVRPRINEAVATDQLSRNSSQKIPRLLPSLQRRRHSRSPDFDSFGPTIRTLRQFISACHDLDGVVRDFLLPNPDIA